MEEGSAAEVAAAELDHKGGYVAEESENWGSDGSAAAEAVVEAENEIEVQMGNRKRKKKGMAEAAAEVGFEDSCFFFDYSMKFPFLDSEIGGEEMEDLGFFFAEELGKSSSCELEEISLCSDIELRFLN